MTLLKAATKAKKHDNGMIRRMCWPTHIWAWPDDDGMDLLLGEVLGNRRLVSKALTINYGEILAKDWVVGVFKE